MKRVTRLILYLIINMIISALTTLTVLTIWDNNHPQPASTDNPLSFPSQDDSQTQLNGAQSAAPLPTEMESLDFIAENYELDIHAIVGVGNLDVEYVEIRNQSQGPIDLTEWQLKDEDGNIFTFPALILNSEGAIKILSKSGNNTVIELYWQSSSPIWESGETATLINKDGETVATYLIP